LIDLGCGNVPLYAVYKPYVDEITCVDWPNSSHMQSHLDFVCDLNSPLPVPDSYFDTIILSDVLEHIAEPKLLWIEMSRILKSGGRALLNVPFYYKIHEAPHDYYRYTEFALRRFADFAKFSIIQLRPIGGAPEVLADLLAKIIYRIPYGGKAFAAFIQFLVHKLGKTTFGQRISTGTAKTFPMGYFMIVEKT
jgi:SAM-dependent methyltransferase